MARSGCQKLTAAVFVLGLLLATPLTALGKVSGQHGPKGAFAGQSAGRCGAFTGSDAVEASKAGPSTLPVSSYFDGFDVVICEKHLRDHSTEIMHKKVGGAEVVFQVFANNDDVPESSSGFAVSSSSKSSSDSSPAASSSSDSVAPGLTSVSFIAQLTPIPSGRRHLLQSFTTAIPDDDEVSRINSWLSDFVRDNADIVNGRDSITATSFKRGVGGVIFFAVFILTDDPATVQARIVELPSYSSPAGDAVLSQPQPCGNGQQVGFGDAENLAQQLSVAPPTGCSNPLEPVVVTPAPAPAAAPAITTSAVTTTPAETTTSAVTSSPAQTSTSAVTTTPAETTTTAATTTPAETTTPAATTTPAETSTLAATTTPAETTTSAATTTPAETTTPAATTTPAETTTLAATTTPAETTTPAATTTDAPFVDDDCRRRRVLLGASRKLLCKK